MKERINKAIKALEQRELDALIVLKESNVRYFTGSRIDYSAAILSRDGVYILAHVLEYERAKRAPLVKEAYAYSIHSLETDIEYLKVKSLEEAIQKLISRLGLDEAEIGYEGEFLPEKKVKLLTNLLPKAKFSDASDLIWELRMIKDQDEIFMTKRACEAAIEGVVASFNAISVGKREIDVAAEALRAMMKKGGFTDLEPIVASGVRSALPHGRATEKTIRDNEFVVIDLCPRYESYYSDITRTIIVGRADRTQRKVYEAVLDAQQTVIDQVKPGMKCNEIDKLAREILRRNNYEKYFIHSTGHGVGLDIHEPPRISQNVDVELKEGMIVTIEPGVYIPGWGGVRIEDTVLITKNGARILTELSRELLEL